MKTSGTRQRQIPAQITGADFKSFRPANGREIRRMEARAARKEAKAARKQGATK
jgi:hypothetical protein